MVANSKSNQSGVTKDSIGIGQITRLRYSEEDEMAQVFSKWFYASKQWKQTRASKLASVNGLCERCLEQNRIKPASDVHHMILLTPSNVHDPNVTMNHEHLICLCKECHNIEHGNGGALRDGLEFDENGQIVERT